MSANLPAESRKSPALLFLFFAISFIVWSYLFFHIGYTVDDALITFRYAENLSAGNGFVYNFGERVFGTTTPLFTVLLALLLRFKLSVFVSAFLLNAIANFFSARALFLFFRDKGGVYAYLPALLFLFSPETLQWTLSGMETQLYITLLLNAFLYSYQERWNVAFVLGAFATLTRIDGIAVVVALIISFIVRYRKFPLRQTLLFVGCLLPWILFAVAYFGSPIPNSAGAKWALSGDYSTTGPAQILLKGFLHLHTLGLPFLLLALYGTLRIVQNDLRTLVIAIWTWSFAIAFTLASGPMHPWYYAPFYAGYLILVLYGLKTLLEHRLQKLKTAGVLSAIIIVLVLSYLRIPRLTAEQKHLETINKAAGAWLQQNTAPEDDVAIKDIGYIGYYSKRKVLDLAGLVSPQCIPFRARNDFLGPIEKFRPAYFAFSTGQVRNLNLEESGLLNIYRRVKTIETYNIYSRK